MVTIKNIIGLRLNKLIVLCESYVIKNDKLRYWWCQCDCGELISLTERVILAAIKPSCGKCPTNNLVGKKFNKLTVVDFDYKDSDYTYWNCICDCGNGKIVKECHLKKGQVKSCGCDKPGNRVQDNISGRRFGRLIAVSKDESKKCKAKGNGSLWNVVCDCGNTKIISRGSLESGRVNSCGCYQSEYMHKFATEQFTNITGHRFGRLVAVRKTRMNGVIKWECKCDCGNTSFHRTNQLTGNKRYRCSHFCLLNPPKIKHFGAWQRPGADKYKYGIWVTFALTRDLNRCQVCGDTCDFSNKALHVHHLFSWKSYPELRYDNNNSITLCGGKNSCHSKFHSQFGNKNNTPYQFQLFKAQHSQIKLLQYYPNV